MKAYYKDSAGFTLVELAIVMIIIGLLVGGVLKGQELINSAKVNRTVAQIKEFDAAISTFREMYRALPGDIMQPELLLPGCAAANGCTNAGNGDGRLDTQPYSDPAVGSETETFFVHLATANLITGMKADGSNPDVWDVYYPSAPINGGGYHPTWSTGLANDFAGTLGPATAARPGLYLSLIKTPISAEWSVLTPSQAQRIDTKLDDGAPGHGDVRAGTEGGGTNCGTDLAYAETETAETCYLHIRIQR